MREPGYGDVSLMPDFPLEQYEDLYAEVHGLLLFVGDLVASPRPLRSMDAWAQRTGRGWRGDISGALEHGLSHGYQGNFGSARKNLDSAMQQLLNLEREVRGCTEHPECRWLTRIVESQLESPI